MTKSTYNDDLMISIKIVEFGAERGVMNATSANFRIQQAIEILTEMSIGDCHRDTTTSIHFCISLATWMPWWKNRGDILQSERRPRMRTSPSERGSGKNRLALGRAATFLTAPWRSISRRRRPANCEKELVAHEIYGRRTHQCQIATSCCYPTGWLIQRLLPGKPSRILYQSQTSTNNTCLYRFWSFRLKANLE